MKIDLSALLNKREREVGFSFTLYPEEIEDCAILPEGFSLRGGIDVSGTVTDCGGYMNLAAGISAQYDTQCDRCLEPIRDSLAFAFTRYVVSSSSEADNLGGDSEDLLWVKEGGVCADREIIEEFNLEIPLYNLCEEDCPGLCPKCGKRLDGTCRCKKEKEFDPRLESFQKLLAKLEKE